MVGKSTVSMHVSRRRVVFALLVAAAEQGEAPQPSSSGPKFTLPLPMVSGVPALQWIKLVILASVLRRSSWLLVN